MKDFFARSVLAKVLLLFLLTVLLAIPLGMIDGLIDQRGHSREAAAQELAAAHAGPQVLLGPVLVVPFVERWSEPVLDNNGNAKSHVQRSEDRVQIVFPERMRIEGRLAPQERYRGIFKVLFYEFGGRIDGRFAPFDAASLPRSQKNSTVEAGIPVVAMNVSDIRGLQGGPVLRLSGETTGFAPRTPHVGESSWLADGIHAPLAASALQAWRQGQALPFELSLAIVGQGRFGVVPVAGETTAHVSSPWAHPSFGGEFLARERTVTGAGFDARWSVSSLVTTARTQILQSRPSGADRGQAMRRLQAFDVSLVEPQNVHSLSDRAVKYGLLFIGLVLMAAFMFELFARLRLHPVQYGLVGLSIALFFLLLLALSEKMAFGTAYAGAAGASVALLTAYFSAVLRGWRRGVGLGTYAGLLYAALYGLLSSEDNALLMGSLLIFGLLAALMLATRKVDWYALSAADPPQASASA